MKFLRGASWGKYRPIWLVVAVVLCCGLSLLSAAQACAKAAAAQGSLFLFPPGRHGQFLHQQTPPTDAMCRATLGVPCYTPQEMYRAYNVGQVLASGITGRGHAIVIIDAFGSPTITHDLEVFDHTFGLPDPPSFRQLAPLGSVAFNPANAAMAGWADETTLDVEWAHALAPGAGIVLLTSPVDETQGLQGLSQFLELERYALSHQLGDIISQSWGTTENTLFTPSGQAMLDAYNQFYAEAAQQHVTVLASAGDNGTANATTSGKQIYPFPTVLFPASSPWVTAVGGTSLNLSTQGAYQSEVVWNSGPTAGATGGGVSQYFAQPDYQKGLPPLDQTLLHGKRGVPDIAYDADPHTGNLVYESFRGGNQVGYVIFGGTSIGAPQWAGIIADADQMAGHSLGFLNEALYRLGLSADSTRAFHDIVQGNNGQSGVAGYSATPGWDATTGWGTPDASNLLPLLIQQCGSVTW